MEMDSKLILASGIKLDKSYTNVLSYNTTQMLSLVESNKEYEQWNYNNIDYDKGVIQVSTDYSVAIGCNYLAFQNPRHGNKWYFAFIDDVIFKSSNCCDVKFTIDVWATFYDNWTAKPCFVVREHVNNDTVGLHTVPETVTTGDYLITSSNVDQKLIDSKIILSANIDPSGNQTYGGIYNGVPSGFRYYVYNINDTQGIRDHITQAQLHNGDINQLFIAPDMLAGTTVPSNHEITQTNTPVRGYTAVNDITTLDTYVPKNSKLLTYPYCFYKLTNLQGQETILHPELWKNYSITYNGTTYSGKLIELMGALTAGCSIRVYPMSYSSDIEGGTVDYGINNAKYPQLNWSTDAYINWLTSQGINQLAGTASNVFSNFPIAGGTAPQTLQEQRAQRFSSGQDIGNFLASNYIAHITPPSVEGNMNASDVMWCRGYSSIVLQTCTIKREFAKQIDDYFSRFGYKINETKTPNITGRTYWNFIEIGQDESIGFGTVPSKYMEIINNACRQGVTIWHSHDNIGNFNLTNSIV